KGIDQYGNQTRIISSYTSNVTNAIKKEAYDGNNSTSITNVTGQYMQVDSSMYGKNIKVRWADYVGSGSGSSKLVFLDNSMQAISSVNCQYTGTGTRDDIFTVPVNTRWIRFDAGPGGISRYAIFEIQPI
ncbi:MAG: hypothetical protein K0R72_1143, partial [Clostridia bacterium]|nr:hypothetical protein [Clostridia bacterium]